MGQAANGQWSVIPTKLIRYIGNRHCDSFLVKVDIIHVHKKRVIIPLSTFCIFHQKVAACKPDKTCFHMIWLIVAKLRLKRVGRGMVHSLTCVPKCRIFANSACTKDKNQIKVTCLLHKLEGYSFCKRDDAQAPPLSVSGV